MTTRSPSVASPAATPLRRNSTVFEFAAIVVYQIVHSKITAKRLVPVLIACGVLAAGSMALAQPPVRREASTLTAAQVKAYRNGVAEMKKRPASDPTSWLYQANMHGTFDTPAQTAWSSCQHFSEFFLSWHRMYLYYFERILRKASGRASFALPYWNYSRPAGRKLPTIFRQPSSEAANPLYVQARAMNGNQQLPPQATSFSDAWGESLFHSDTAPSFSGNIEGQPHGAIHNLVGGTNGWMASFEMAARDPIFWLHHANIDRLWESWVQAGNANPTTGPWTTMKFTFFDETGAMKQLTGAEVVDIAKQLNYRYDRLETAPGAFRQTTPPTTTQQRIGSGPDGGVQLGSAPGDVDVRLEGGRGEGQLLPPSTGPSRYVLQFAGVDAGPGAYYEVYVNLPKATANPQPASPHFAGILSPFGRPHHTEPRLATLRLDITRTLDRLREAKLVQASPNVRLTFVPRGADSQAGRLAPPSEMRMRIGSVQLVLLQ